MKFASSILAVSLLCYAPASFADETNISVQDIQESSVVDNTDNNTQGFFSKIRSIIRNNPKTTAAIMTTVALVAVAGTGVMLYSRVDKSAPEAAPEAAPKKAAPKAAPKKAAEKTASTSFWNSLYNTCSPLFHCKLRLHRGEQ